MLEFVNSSCSIESFNCFISLLYKDSKLPSSTNKCYKKIFIYSAGLSLEGRAKKLSMKEYSISEWLEALSSINDWLDKENSSASLDSMIEYIACATEVLANSGIIKLKIIVEDFLKNYGFENKSELL